MKMIFKGWFLFLLLGTFGCPDEVSTNSSLPTPPTTPSSQDPSAISKSIAVASFSVDDLTGATDLAAQWSQGVERQVEEDWFAGKSSGFERLSSSDKGARIKISTLYSIQMDGTPGKEETPAMASVGMEVEALDPVEDDVPRRFLATVQIAAPFGGGVENGNIVFADLLKQCLLEARLEIRVRMEVWRGTDQQVLSCLSSRNPVRLEESIRAIGERKITKGAVALLSMLDEDHAHVFEAVGALAGLKEPTALKPLSRLTSSMDPQLLQVVVYAMADIGGEEAKRYLRAIATGHPWPTIRTLAEERLGQGKVP